MVFVLKFINRTRKKYLQLIILAIMEAYQQASQKQPTARKKYTELTGSISFHPKYLNGTLELPNIWIDPNDLETILQFCKFWKGNYMILLNQVRKLDRMRMNDYCILLKRCADTCAGLSKYQRQHSLLFQYSHILELEYSQKIDVTIRKMYRIEGKQDKLQSQFSSHEQRLKYYNAKYQEKPKGMGQILNNFIRGLFYQKQQGIQKQKQNKNQIKSEVTRQEEDLVNLKLNSDQPQ